MKTAIKRTGAFALSILLMVVVMAFASSCDTVEKQADESRGLSVGDQLEAAHMLQEESQENETEIVSDTEEADTEVLMHDTVTEEMTEAASQQIEEEQNKVTYVLNVNSDKFHKPGCPSVSTIKPENRRDFYGTREEAVEMNYDPCGRCKP